MALAAADLQPAGFPVGWFWRLGVVRGLGTTLGGFGAGLSSSQLGSLLGGFGGDGQQYWILVRYWAVSALWWASMTVAPGTLATVFGTSAASSAELGELLGGFGGSLSTNEAVTLGACWADLARRRVAPRNSVHSLAALAIRRLPH